MTTVVTPPTDTTAPTTVSDAKATYDSSATIKLTATDNTDGSGVAHTYYVLDGAAQAEGTSVSTSVAGTHTLEFWSADVAGNIESPRNSATFVVTTVVTPPVVSTHTVRLHISLHHADAHKLTATLTNKSTGAKFVGKIDRKGNVVFTDVPTGTYRFKVSGKHFNFRTQTIYVGGHHWNHRR